MSERLRLRNLAVGAVTYVLIWVLLGRLRDDPRRWIDLTGLVVFIGVWLAVAPWAARHRQRRRG